MDNNTGSVEIKTLEFDYAQLDAATAQLLKKKEENMREHIGRAYTEVGKSLKEAQDILSQHRYGCFEEWYTSMGFKRQTVYNLIQRYDLILQRLEDRNLLEELPVSLTYEIAKPTADPELTQKVLDGEISTLQQLKQAKKEAEDKQLEAERAMRFARLETEGYKREIKALREQAGIEGEAPHIEPVEIEKIVEVEKIVEKEVVPEDYEATKKRLEQLEEAANKAAELEEKLEEANRLKQKFEKELEAHADVKLQHLNTTRFTNSMRSAARGLADGVKVAEMNMDEVLPEKVAQEVGLLKKEMARTTEIMDEWVKGGGFIDAEFEEVE